MAFVGGFGGILSVDGAARRSAVVCSAQEGGISRRGFLLAAAGTVIGGAVSTDPAKAKLLPKSKEELMEELKTKKTPEEIEAERAAKAEERRIRLEKQKQLVEEQERKKAEGGAENEAEIDANLRANYYYPTARKRYLPRIKDCADKIDETRAALEAGNWEKVVAFIDGPADSTVGPLKLYASSLAGQGLSLKVTYVEDMTKYATDFEKELKILTKAAKKRKAADSKKAFENLDTALQGYRKAAKIDTPDGGVGEVPTDKRLGSGFSNLLPRKLD